MQTVKRVWLPCSVFVPQDEPGLILFIAVHPCFTTMSACYLNVPAAYGEDIVQAVSAKRPNISTTIS